MQPQGIEHLSQSSLAAVPCSIGCMVLFYFMNSLFVIVPYRYEGMWVFDDPSVGLNREPFISGIDRMIDRLVEKLPEAERGFRLVFSPNPFPGYAVKLEHQREEYGGNWYYCGEFGIEGWLCPALFKYFKTAPATLYAKAEPKAGGNTQSQV